MTHSPKNLNTAPIWPQIPQNSPIYIANFKNSHISINHLPSITKTQQFPIKPLLLFLRKLTSNFVVLPLFYYFSYFLSSSKQIFSILNWTPKNAKKKSNKDESVEWSQFELLRTEREEEKIKLLYCRLKKINLATYITQCILKRYKSKLKKLQVLHFIVNSSASLASFAFFLLLCV